MYVPSVIIRKKQLPIYIGTAYISIPYGVNLLWYNQKESENIVLDILVVDVLFGKSNASATLNMLIILMKNFIYKQRVNKSIQLV